MQLPVKKPVPVGILLIIVVCAVCVVCTVFFPNVSAFFHSDDLDLLWFVKTSSLSELWRNSPTGYFRPLVSLGLWAEWHLWGTNPLGYHLTHCLLHMVNCVLVCQIGKVLGFSRKSAFAAGLLFLVLPGHSEAVAWIADNYGVLATLFTLLAIRLFFIVRQKDTPNERIVWGAGLVICCVLAFLSKESALFLPVVAALLDRMRPLPHSKTLSRWAVLLFLLMPIYLTLRWFNLGSALGGPGGSPHISPGLLLWGLVRALPAALCPMTATVASFVLAATVFLLLGAGALFRIESAARRDVLYLLAAFYVSVLPGVWTSLSPPLWGYDTRVLYPASAFACLAFVRLLEALRSALPKFPVFPVLAALFALYSVQSFLIFQQWNLAGEWVRTGIDTMATFPSCKRRIVLVSPDIRYPAYVFRRGLQSGLDLLTSNPPQSVETLTLAVFYDDRDRVDLIRDANGRGVTVRIHYASPVLKKTPVIDPANAAAIPLVSSDPAMPDFHLALSEPQPGDQFVYFSEGQFHLWNNGSK